MDESLKKNNHVKTQLKSAVRQQLLADFLDLADRIIENLFKCGPSAEESPSQAKQPQLPPLADFGWMIIHRCQLSFTNVVLAILYLIRLKQKHPTCKGAHGSGHRLFLAALIVANKYLYDDAYHNHTWAEVSNGIFHLEEVNRMEFELIYFLNFGLTVTFKQWFELVDLLDGKLHNELVNVGCTDSTRHRLSKECGIDPESAAKFFNNQDQLMPTPPINYDSNLPICSIDEESSEFDSSFDGSSINDDIEDINDSADESASATSESLLPLRAHNDLQDWRAIRKWQEGIPAVYSSEEDFIEEDCEENVSIIEQKIQMNQTQTFPDMSYTNLPEALENLANQNKLSRVIDGNMLPKFDAITIQDSQTNDITNDRRSSLPH